MFKRIRKNNRLNHSIWLLLIFLSFYALRFLLRISSPIPDSSIEVDTRIITGLLTASSIIFGFSMNILREQTRYKTSTVFMMILQTIFIFYAGMILTTLGINEISSLEALKEMLVTFSAIIFINGITMGLTSFKVFDSDRTESEPEIG